MLYAKYFIGPRSEINVLLLMMFLVSNNILHKKKINKIQKRPQNKLNREENKQQTEWNGFNFSTRQLNFGAMLDHTQVLVHFDLISQTNIHTCLQ